MGQLNAQGAVYGMVTQWHGWQHATIHGRSASGLSKSHFSHECLSIHSPLMPYSMSPGCDEGCGESKDVSKFVKYTAGKLLIIK